MREAQRLATILVLCSVVGCGSSPPDRVEGTEVGDCNDGADNDADGLFDCADDSCTGSPLCAHTADAAMGDGAMMDSAGMDAAMGDGAMMDSAGMDAAMGDGAMMDGAVMDAAMGDGAMMDGAVMDAAMGDGAVMDSAVMDAAMGDGAMMDGAVMDAAMGDGAVMDAAMGDGAGMDGAVTVCSPSCSSSQRCCGTSCSNRQAPAGVLDGRSDGSFINCNGCGLACDAERASVCGQQLGGSGPPQCLCGNFAQCAVGQICVNSGGTFTCADLSSDPNNCGTEGNVCAEGESCVGGSCGCGGTGAACTTGQACCGGGCVDVTSDAMNCGACGMACNAGETCSGGSCGCGTTGAACRAPTAGTFGMGGDPGESCCGGVCVPNTDTNCVCTDCTADGTTCQVAGGSGGDVHVCCGDLSVAILGCGGALGGDGGLAFP